MPFNNDNNSLTIWLHFLFFSAFFCIHIGRMWDTAFYICFLALSFDVFFLFSHFYFCIFSFLRLESEFFLYFACRLSSWKCRWQLCFPSQRQEFIKDKFYWRIFVGKIERIRTHILRIRKGRFKFLGQVMKKKGLQNLTGTWNTESQGISKAANSLLNKLV